ncbi:tyrosine-protein kinase SYK-like [Anneissia japonica]|uniref:tyrosine-protein kinase SYK-like n=1 Tax=Anneissia japonica TaxID=1529436 RepID=UPI001425B450|nr:tyrosine-protein kinase SYK-like [Anneissia japonica]
MSRYMARSKNPLNERYFFGRITREQAEERLKEANCGNGYFLLRESLQKNGSYVLSLYHGDGIYHYAIDRQYDNTVAIRDGKKFPGPIELVQHYKVNADGLLCKLTKPVTLKPGEQPRAFDQMSHSDLDQQIISVGEKMGISSDIIETAMRGDRKGQFVQAINSVLHQTQPWFHGKLSREDAEKRILRSRPKDGSYLVRERAEEGTFALSLFFGRIVYHYKIDKNHTGELSIKDGPKFQSLMQMIDHYILKKDGLLCCLTLACSEMNTNRLSVPDVRPLNSSNFGSIGNRPGSASDISLPPREPPPVPPTSRPHVTETDHGRGHPPPVPPPNNRGAASLNSGSLAGRNVIDKRLYGIPNDQEKIYDHVAKTKKTKTLNRENLSLMNQLGKGNFGSVLKGTYRVDGRDVPVAVKTLKDVQVVQNGSSEIIREADLMADLDHPHIVRMIGVCRGDDMMLVLELAELGPLHKYLKKHQHVTIHNILELMLQVAQGMQYLESRQFVHRDLAARNVLLVSETFAKISDFGMSKALVKDNNYYVAEQAGRWPLKWYAPECIYKFKFSSKSDVWSYGVTLWEAMSYGKKPYVNMKGQEILDMIENHKRLDCPEACPEDVYNLMLSCWEYEAKDRCSFSKIAETMKDILLKLKTGTLKMR